MLQESVTTSALSEGHFAYSSNRPSACAGMCRFFLDEHAPCRTLGDSSIVRRIGKGETIYARGEAARFSYRVIEGAVRLSHILMDGHRQLLNFFLPGETFGIEQSANYMATAEAVSDVVILRCPRSCVAEMSADHPAMRDKMMAMLSAGMTLAQDHVVMLGHQSARERVASFLLRLADHAGATNGKSVDIPVGRQDIADYLGLTVETTCRVLSHFKARRLIGIPKRQRIDIRNIAGLRAIVGGDA